MYRPQFIISNKVLKNISAVEGARQVIHKAPLLPYYEKKFQNDALVRSVHFGTRIEGNELDLSQAEKVMMGQDVPARERDIQEVINYRKVIEYIGQLGDEVKKTLSENLLLDLHRLTVNKLFEPERCGVYRTAQVVIKNSQTGEISFRPPSPLVVPFQVRDLLVFINNISAEEIHPVLKSGIVHYELVRIHPFIDGNGRVARAMSTLILFLEGYDIRKFFSLEEYFDSNASRYYDALQSVDRKNGDLTDWLEYFTEGLAIELSKIRDRVERVSVDVQMKEKLGGEPLMLTERQLRIMEFIQKNGYIQNQSFHSLFPHISEDSVLLDLRDLIRAGILKKQGKTRGARYMIV